MSTVRTTSAPRVDLWPPRACEGVDPRWFFPKKEGHLWTETAAKRICGDCEAIYHCARYALPIEDLDGVWAGLNAQERAAARKARQKKEA